MFKIKYFIIFLLFNIFTTTYSTYTQTVIDGVLDLTNADFDKNIFKLHGEWDIHRNRHINPESTPVTPPERVKIPSIFKPSHRKSPFGRATLKLKILLPENTDDIFQIRFKRVVSSYKLYINGEKKVSCGNPGSSIESTTPDYSPVSVTFPVKDDTIELVMHISNYHSPTGAGIFQEIYFGTPDTMVNKMNLKLFFETVIAGFLISTGLFHFILFSYKRNDKSLLCLAFLCLLMGLRSLFIDSVNLYYFFDSSKWELLHKLEIFTIIGSAPFLAVFFRDLFRAELNKNYINFYVILSFIIAFFLFILPPPFFYHTLTVYYLPSMTVFIYAIINIIHGAIKKTNSSHILIAGFVVLFITVVNDVLFAIGILNTGFLISYGAVLFILSQTALITGIQNKIYNSSIALSEELKLYNRDLEFIAEERKEELKKEILEKEKVKEELNKRNKLESIGILAGGIAHEFNNLLTIMLGNIFLIRQYTDSENVISSVNEAEIAGKKAADLTNQMLTFSRGGTPFKRLTYLKDLIKFNAEDILRNSDIEYYIEIPDDLYECEVDPEQMGQVIRNIITNSKEAVSDKGKIIIKVYACEIKDYNKILPKGKFTVISITDNGEGINREITNKIFDPFFTTKQGAKGLGLSICYSIIQKHGGAITVESELGKGSTFSVYIKAMDKRGSLK